MESRYKALQLDFTKLVDLRSTVRKLRIKKKNDKDVSLVQILKTVL